MKKLFICCLALLLVVGCSQNQKSATDETIKLLNESIELTHTLQNYSKHEVAKVNIATNEQVILDTFSTIETSINNTDSLGEGYTKMMVAVDAVGESGVEVWTKDGKFYIQSDGARTIQEGSFEEYEKQLGESDFSAIIEKLDYKNGVVKESGTNTVLRFQLNDEQIIQILESQGQLVNETKYKVSKNYVEFVLNQDKYLVEINLELLLDLIEDEATITTEVSLSSVISDINSTVVEFPSDLEDFSNKEVTNKTNQNELMKLLVSKADYTETNSGIVEYDWGTEVYQFDFNKMEFNLITDSGTYTYNWSDDTGNLGGVCTYNFTESKNYGCMEEQVATIQLAKELFIQECQFIGVVPSSLN